jgi:hypothetical protein
MSVEQAASRHGGNARAVHSTNSEAKHFPSIFLMSITVIVIPINKMRSEAHAVVKLFA